MKNIILILIFLSVGTELFAQLKLTDKGFVSQSDETKNYIVLDIPGKSKSMLFKETMVQLNKLYTSPKDVISSVDGESITINGIEKAAIRRTDSHRFTMNYTVVFEFKDDKIKVNQPTFILSSFAAGHEQTMHLVFTGFSMDGSNFGIYGKKSELKNDKAKADLEGFFNNYITSLSRSINKKEDW